MLYSPINSESFFVSLEKALTNPHDIGSSIKRLQQALNRTAVGKLYPSNQGNMVVFYTVVDGIQKYLSKRSESLYPLARRRYLELLLEILKLTYSTKKIDIEKRTRLISKLKSFIDSCERGNLDIARIVLTSKQYKWYMGRFRQKSIDINTPFRSTCGIPVRSKSERDILNACEGLAVPFHYEEQQIIYVKPMVDKLERDLVNKGVIRGHVYSYNNGYIHWNVPAELEWMNAPGSIWMTYYPPNGTIGIYNDIKVMLADEEIIIWEHEGLMEIFTYRFNASERAAIMKYTECVSKGNLIETYERDIDTPEKIIDIIERYILPRLWF